MLTLQNRKDSLDFKMLSRLLSAQDLIKNEKQFSLEGKIHLLVITTTKSSGEDLMKLLETELEKQFVQRLTVLKNDSTLLVAPFALNTDNLKKIKSFELHLPCRKLFLKNSGMHATKILLSDYQMHYESEKIACKRIFESSGLKIKSFLSQETVPNLKHKILSFD